MRSWMYGDPAKVLERRGEDCDHCRHLELWGLGGKSVTVCAKKRKVGKRCSEWQHERQGNT